MRGRLRDLTMNRDRTQNITVTVSADFRESFDRLKDKDLDIEIKVHREKRSRNANAYFHVLVNKIAQELNEADEAVKTRLVIDYGVVAKDEDGLTIGFKLPATVDVSKIYPYTRLFDRRTEGGKLFNCYLVLKHTSDMDTKEMARLIDGAIEEAKELGIETDTPETLARYREEWARYDRQHPTD
ncbi:MAG: hypothetical protein IKP40_13600 [Clostridia bacterium]|nr:hypothetical protein [Clostridia bacterium]